MCFKSPYVQVPMEAPAPIRLQAGERVAPNRHCCNTLLAGYAHTEDSQWAKVNLGTREGTRTGIIEGLGASTHHA